MSPAQQSHADAPASAAAPTHARPPHEHCPPKGRFCLNIEGVETPWPVSTVTMEQIAELGKWDPSVGVIYVDAENNERTLQPGEVVEVKPGVGFCKKVGWKRGGRKWTHA